MRKYAKKLMTVMLCLMLCASGAALADMTDGAYTATEAGMMGDVTVTLTVENGRIASVEAVGEQETAGIGTLALEQLPGAIVEAQSAEVDAVTGATVTSTAIKNAAAKCIAQANGEAVEEAAEEAALEADVIVVGGGAAGLSAASAAREAGASVIVLEAAGHTGGAAALSAGNIDSLGAETLLTLGRNDGDVKAYLEYTAEDFPTEYADDLAKVQADAAAYLADAENAAAYDSVERVMLDHYMKGKGVDLDGNPATLNYAYIREGVEANEAIHGWLADAGLAFTQPSQKHFITPVGGGKGLTDTLLSIAENAGATIVCNARGMRLVTDENGRVNGVVALVNGEEVTYTANKAVILATGGFSANAEMVAAYQRVSTGLSADNGSTNPPTNIGDGIRMAEEVGAKLYDMQFVGFLWRGYRGLATGNEANAIGAAKQLAVNMEGVRFTNDASGNLQNAALSQTDAVACMVGDKAMADALEAGQTGLVESLESRGVLFSGDTLEEAAQKAGVDAQALAATVASFNEMVEKGEDPDFGRTEFNGKVEIAPFIIAKTQPVNHLTYGGVDTDNDAHVLREDGSAIPGLYAAGDVVAGYEGYAHQTGECLTLVMYYGKKAGANAAAEEVEKTPLTDGTYSATVPGRNGPLTLTLTVSGGALADVVIGENEETEGVADPALENLPAEIVAAQSIGVDTITGATVTSKAILAAVADCIEQAGGKAGQWNTKVEKVAGEDIELTADVVVIGAGGAGLTAASTAGEQGASVIVIDKAAVVGGNTILCGGAFNAADPEMQKLIEMSESQRKELATYLDMDEADFGDFGETLAVLKGQIEEYLASGETYLFDSIELHMIQSYTGSKRTGLDGTVIVPNFELVSTLCHQALDGWHWLQQIGVPTNDTLSTAVGALWMRTHGVTVPATGAKPLTDALEAYAHAQNVQLIMNTEATEFIVEDGVVTGVLAHKNDGTKVILHANHGVVLATGGFAGNVEMCVEYNNYWPDLTVNARTDNTATAKGDGIRMAQAVGANTVGMGFIQMLPTCTALDGQAGKGVGSKLYVNAEGLRYVNENSERDILCQAALAQTGGVFYGVGDAGMIKMQGEAKIAESEEKGYVFVADTLEEVAAKAGVDGEQLVKTVEQFNSYVDAQEDPDFGRYAFSGKVETAPFVIAAMSPALHHTMGGVEIDTETQVIDVNGNPIPGLYAAGEVCGGIHAGNRLGGNAVADTVVFGRIAGQNAAAFNR